MPNDDPILSNVGEILGEMQTETPGYLVLRVEIQKDDIGPDGRFPTEVETLRLWLQPNQVRQLHSICGTALGLPGQ